MERTISNKKTERRGFLSQLGKVILAGGLFGAFTKTLASDKSGDSVKAGSEDFLGSIGLVGFNFTPAGYFACNGATISVNNNSALFSLLYTQFGGDGRTTFCLPNLQGRVPLGYDQTHPMGYSGGTPTITLFQNNLPAHTHTIFAKCSNSPSSDSPVNNYPAANNEGIKHYGATGTETMSPDAFECQSAGTSQPFPIMQPYLPLNYIICANGFYPQRS